MAKMIDPSETARSYRTEIKAQINQIGAKLQLVGFLSSDYPPSITYANYTKAGCDDVGIAFDIRQVNKLHLEEAVDQANADKSVHGIIIYYPIFATEQDAYIRDALDHRKDIEGLNSFWARRLYHNDRYVDNAQEKKSILPCTPLAIVKLLKEAEALGAGDSPLAGKIVTIFNRSEVVGRPLANMLANDGAEVYSFDVDGPILFKRGELHETRLTRAEALAQSDVVITGVPSRSFPLVSAQEIKQDVVCINFSTFKNFEDDVKDKARVFVPRVGPMTVAMALRNTLRLYHNFHAGT